MFLLHAPLDERMAHTESGCGELVCDGRIDRLVIHRRIAGSLRSQAISIHERSAEDQRKEFVVRDVLE